MKLFHISCMNLLPYLIHLFVVVFTKNRVVMLGVFMKEMDPNFEDGKLYA